MKRKYEANPEIVWQAVVDATAQGLCVVPPRGYGEKNPVGQWKQFQKRLPTQSELDTWYYSERLGIGLLCGAVSGNLEPLDFDDEAVYLRYVQAARACGLGELVDRVEAGYLESTPSGGRHWLVYVPVAGGNVKLASRPKEAGEMRHPKDKVKTLIETRGEGGYLVVAPTHGHVHDSLRPYVLTSGGFASIVTLTEAERDALHTLARTFDLMPRAAKNGRGGYGRVQSGYDASTTWAQVLEPEGWSRCSDDGEVTQWTRPGKDCGVSATTNYGGYDLLYVFTSSTEFEPNKSYTRFAAYAVLAHGGDFTAARKSLSGRADFAGATSESPANTDETDKKTITSQLLDHARELFEPVRDSSGDPHVIPLNGPHLAIPLKSRDFCAQLAATFHAKTGQVAGATAIASVVTIMHGWAIAKEPMELALRSASIPGGVVLDLGTKDGSCVIISGTGWQVHAKSPVTFRRTKLTHALPTPTVGGSLDRLGEVMNLGEDAWPLLVAWQVCQLLGRETPIAAFTGESGTGKSWAARFMVTLTDPTPAPLRSTPTDLENWVVAAAGSRIVALDNLSRIPEWLSDALCRAVTGEGLVRRERYSDSEIALIAIRRAVAFTSIHPGDIRGDLAERLLPLKLEPIDSTRRLSDSDIRQRWDAMHADVLGGLLDLTAEVLAVLSGTHFEGLQLPRMAAFAEVLHAVDGVLGTDGLTTYRDLLATLEADVLDGDLVAQGIVALVTGGGNKWVGTATQLLAAMEPPTIPRDWPQSAAQLGARIVRAMPVLRESGIEVTHPRTSGERLIRFQRR
jgi:Bifunctional DNA primase/polymerase, N-terminal